MGIEPLAFVCGLKDVVVWQLEYYLPFPGKELGISTKFFTSEDLYSLKNKYGFTNIAIDPSEYNLNLALSNGFDTVQVMPSVFVNSQGQFSYPHGNFKYYFIDEPFERSENVLTPQQVVSIANDIAINNSNARLNFTSWHNVVSAYSHQIFAVLLSTSNTIIMCDQYYDETILCGNNQSEHWTNFKDAYGGNSRVNGHFIHLLIDGEQNDFNRLLNHANSLGVNRLWLYAGDAKGWCGNKKLTRTFYNRYLIEFSSSAFSNYWLRAIQRKYIYEYRCSLTDPCNCNTEIPDGWYLYKIWPMNEYREIFPGSSQN